MGSLWATYELFSTFPQLTKAELGQLFDFFRLLANLRKLLWPAFRQLFDFFRLFPNFQKLRVARLLAFSAFGQLTKGNLQKLLFDFFQLAVGLQKQLFKLVNAGGLQLNTFRKLLSNLLQASKSNFCTTPINSTFQLYSTFSQLTKVTYESSSCVVFNFLFVVEV